MTANGVYLASGSGGLSALFGFYWDMAFSSLSLIGAMAGPKATCASVKEQRGRKGGDALRIVVFVLGAWQWAWAPLSSVNCSDPVRWGAKRQPQWCSWCWGSSFWIVGVGTSVWSSTNVTSDKQPTISLLRVLILAWMKKKKKEWKTKGGME